MIYTIEEFTQVLKDDKHLRENVYPKLWAKNRSKKHLAQFHMLCRNNRKRHKALFITK